MTDVIKADTRVETLFREYPEVIDYLLSLGICECDGVYLRKTISAMAKEKGVDVEEFLQEINKRIR